MRILKYNIKLTNEEVFKLKVMDAYRNMNPKNIRYLCKLFGIGKSTFYRWKAEYKPYNLASLKYKSRKPKRLKTIDWSTVIEICDWKRANPKKSHYYLYQTWLKEGKTPLCSSKTIYNWWKRRGLIEANSIDFLKVVLGKARRKGIIIKLVQTDNGKEFQTSLREYLLEANIKHQYTWIHTPDQNGVVERSHRTLMKRNSTNSMKHST